MGYHLHWNKRREREIENSEEEGIRRGIGGREGEKTKHMVTTKRMFFKEDVGNAFIVGLHKGHILGNLYIRTYIYY